MNSLAALLQIAFLQIAPQVTHDSSGQVVSIVMNAATLLALSGFVFKSGQILSEFRRMKDDWEQFKAQYSTTSQSADRQDTKQDHKLDEIEKRVSVLEALKIEVLLTRITTQLEILTAGFNGLQRGMHDVKSIMMLPDIEAKLKALRGHPDLGTDPTV